MTNIEQKALELVNEVWAQSGLKPLAIYEARNYAMFGAICRAIERREAFRQEVSKAIVNFVNQLGPDDDIFRQAMEYLDGFIITKPDQLVEAVKDILDEDSLHNAEEFSEAIRAALAKRGLEIREKSK